MTSATTHQTFWVETAHGEGGHSIRATTAEDAKDLWAERTGMPRYVDTVDKWGNPARPMDRLIATPMRAFRQAGLDEIAEDVSRDLDKAEGDAR